MDWFPFHISDLSTPKLSAATSSAFGAWVRMLANCYRLGNGGYYEYCSEYNSRQWMSIAGVDKTEVDEVVKAGLASWDAGGLRVDGYDQAQELKAKNRSDKARLAIKTRWSNTRSNTRSNTEERRGEERKGEEREIPPRDPCTTEPAAHPQARGDHWLSSFGASWAEKNGKMYGRASADSRAAGELTDLLASLPDSEVAALWERRKELFAEFFDNADQRTVKAGLSFSFFVAGFRGAMLPQAMREKARAGPQPRKYGGSVPEDW